MSPDQILAIQERADCLYTPEAVAQAYDKLAQAIGNRLGGAFPLVITVMNGGLIPAGKLLSRMPFPLNMDYLHATRYGDATRGGALHWYAKPTTPMRGRSVLIIDDIFDEGHTLAAIRQYCLDQGAREVLTAVLVNKRHDRKVDMRVDFVGLEVEDRFIFGEGMDVKGFFRNLNGIYAIPEE